MLKLDCSNKLDQFINSFSKFKALAGGTILYVCVFEILEREKNKKHVSGLLQLLFVILGVLSLLTIEIFGT